MPILEQEPASFPASLLEPTANLRSSLAAEGRCWTVLQTKSRQEKALARDLVAAEIPFYLPLTPHEHLIRGKRVVSHIPVLGGYLFLFGTLEERNKALRTNRIARSLPVYDQDRLDADLVNLAALIAADVPLTVEKRLEPGRRVRVKSGPLMGLEGVIIQRRGTNRLLVAVTYLQQGVSVETNDFMVEPCES
ncbi:MAG: hypothetical protein U1A77_08235 [Pirellulales bacterium]